MKSTISLPQQVSAQARHSPDSLALAADSSAITYQQLEARSNQLAHALRDLGVVPDQPVGLLIPRAPGAVVGALGILKACGAYLPLDPAYPSDRLTFMLTDAGIHILVTDAATLPLVPAGSWRTVCLEE